jgi:phytoene desaturase
MPMYIEDLFKTAQVPIEGYFSYEKQDIVCQYFWEDGTRFTAWADIEKFAQEIENQLNINKDILKTILKKAERKYNTVGNIFLENSLHKRATWLNLKVLKALFLIPTFDIFKTMNRTHELLAHEHPQLVQFLNRFATYNGSNPYRASGMLSMIPHFEHGIGCFYPKGGMYEISKTLYNLALKKGVHFHFNQTVSEIIVKNKQAAGLKIGEKTTFFDKIISNMDVYFTYKKLLPHEKHPEKTIRQERSTSGLIFYWGVKKSFPELHLHNIFFSNDYQHEFVKLDKGDICDDPTIYINITSKLTPTDAPTGGENWFVLINAPSNSGSQNWENIIARVRVNVIRKISKILNVDFHSLIEVESILDPLSIEAKTASYAGALYGTSSNSMMSAFLRHPNFTHQIKNLYFVGGSVHPGGGIPLALLSAKIVDDLI